MTGLGLGARLGEAPPALAVTMGDPAGIGLEITLGAWRARAGLPPFFLIADPAHLKAHASDTPWREIADPAEAASVFPNTVPVLPVALAVDPVPGRPDPRNAPAVVSAIDRAVELAQTGQAAAVVTNPVSKQVLYEGADFRYPGHTEYLAHLGRVPSTVMMLAGPDLRVVPVTIHIPLADVPGALTTDLIVETARITARDLRARFGIKEPRLALSGLNPHAGEGGSMGREEIEVIKPAIEVLGGEGLTVSGPHPADTMFHAEARRRYDVALCMYHDQALVPLKTLDFDRGVNVTLGLPFVRTSPDHGTAFDIAGKGIARPDSLIAALRMAGDMAERRCA